MHVFHGARYYRVAWEVHEAKIRRDAFAIFGVRLPPSSEVSDEPPLRTFVTTNLWAAECPDCHTAMLVWVERPVLMCSGCLNAVVDHRWRRVTLPKEAERLAIEAVLQARPLPHTRNWRPGETIADLMAENDARGHSVARGLAARPLIPDVEG